LDNDYCELPILSEHAALAIDALPPTHRDPFDRMLIAQATVEGITLLTTDVQLAKYPGPVQCI
jgi:PIN domain nuclease of toxin-antitoxin system